MKKPAAGRRTFLIQTATALAGTATAGIAAAASIDEPGARSRTLHGSEPWQEGRADAPRVVSGEDFRYFTPAERAFVETAVARLIPNDETGPGALEAGVPFFLDRQLAGPFGRGDHYYLQGPWKKGVPEQGYQSRFTPAQLYRAAMQAIDKHTAAAFGGHRFAQLSEAQRDQVLEGLEKGSIALDGGVDAKTFFKMLLQNTKEGYFSDPIYGGNKDMGAWKMIGFPGARYDYSEWVTRHGEKVTVDAVGIEGRPGWREA